MFPYRWNLRDGYPKKRHNKTVFGTFVCGGGSTMGYKLAGYNHLGGVEIDPKLAKIYKANHNPKYFYLEDIREFNKRDDLPEELYNLDLLDGSPPCSTFSMAGSREDGWSKKKKFREGQAEQVLDDLVYVYCETIKKLKPKVFLLENVKGMILGNAKIYTKNIVKIMEEAGYKVQIFLLNAASMGVPQRRERVFIIGTALDVKLLRLSFNEKPIEFKDLSCDYSDEKMSENEQINWEKSKPGESVGKFNTYKKLEWNRVANTIVASNPHYHPKQKRRLNYEEEKLISTFPLDFNFYNQTPRYIMGMSVPPVMIAQIANQIYLQWLK